ncbi:MAG: nicotinate-nucleotide adenylyltransferase [Acidobacteria bacterium]|nr:nicotinate-nucleotide adenylyltransferase [Acidobacteriota bacterium]
MTIARRTGVLGGTFDPIHVGHLAVAGAARRLLGLDDILIIPSLVPPHRAAGPSASPFHRFAMVAMVCAAHPYLVASDIELVRPGPSYTADTLRRLHAAGHAALQIFFLTGADAFAEIATWREYPGVLSLAHFVVSSRPGISASELPARLPGLASRMMTVRDDGVPVADEQAPRVYLLDCPTPDVSSTDIRSRARDHRSISGLVPPEIDRHIRRHGLYGAPPEPAPTGGRGGGQFA